MHNSHPWRHHPLTYQQPQFNLILVLTNANFVKLTQHDVARVCVEKVNENKERKTIEPVVGYVSRVSDEKGVGFDRFHNSFEFTILVHRQHFNSWDGGEDDYQRPPGPTDGTRLQIKIRFIKNISCFIHQMHGLINFESVDYHMRLIDPKVDDPMFKPAVVCDKVG